MSFLNQRDMLLTDCACPSCRAQRAADSLNLGPVEQRKIVEATVKEPCFRMWMTRAEFDASGTPKDWTAYTIDREHVAVWRKRSDVTRLLASNDPADRELGILIQSRELPDVNNADSVPAGA